VLSALKANRISRTDIDSYAQSLSQLINNEHDGLFAKSQGIARDNDLYLAQTLALLGKSWMTLNLRPDALSGEQAERRALAQERFSYPVHAAPGAYTGKFVDILPALPAFASAAEGAGFTNVEIDPDGIRRRIYLTQKIHDHWYLQLAFAPLVDYLGRPELELDRRRLLIKGAALPGAAKKDIAIPLDSGGRMMIDWPPEDYQHSFRHISFDKFSLLEDIELQMQQYCRALESADLHFFAGFDSSLTRAIFITGELANLFDAIQAARTAALEQCSEEEFASYTAYRARSRELIRELIDLDAGTKISALASSLSAEFPEDAGAIGDMAEYIKMLVDYLAQVLEQYEDTSEKIKAVVNGNFCILGRVDTGTTDIGANPFWGEYVNVGTHAVVLDMILSESFIIALRQWWSVLFMLLFVPVFFLVSAKLNPVPRAASGFVITALVVTASLLLFRFAGIFFAPLGTVLAMVSAVVVREIMSYAGSEREKQFIHKAFSTYVSDEVVKEIIADPSRLQLGGTKRHMSAIFTDIQGFSTISEQLDPEDLVSLLNRSLPRTAVW
jgi:adenylate cyclase